MEIQEAKALFQLDIEFKQEDLDKFYNLEKNLLLQRLSDDASEDELKETQSALDRLEEAYEVLSVEVCSFEESIADDGKKKQQTQVAAGILLLILAGGAYFYFNSQATPPSTQVTAKPKTTITETAKTEQAGTSDLDQPLGNPQQEALLAAEAAAIQQLDQWQVFSEPHGFPLPKRISDLKEEGDLFKKHNRLSQATYAYNEVVTALRDHQKQHEGFVKTFKRYEKLSQTWLDLAKRESFVFERHPHYQNQFSTVNSELKNGIFPSSSQAVLEQVCFIYEKTTEKGQKVAAMRKEYKQLKTRWEKNVLGGGFYTLTPSVEELLNTADQKTYYAGDFENLMFQVFPRLINHFKQHLN